MYSKSKLFSFVRPIHVFRKKALLQNQQICLDRTSGPPKWKQQESQSTCFPIIQRPHASTVTDLICLMGCLHINVSLKWWQNTQTASKQNTILGLSWSLPWAPKHEALRLRHARCLRCLGASWSAGKPGPVGYQFQWCVRSKPSVQAVGKDPLPTSGIAKKVD